MALPCFPPLAAPPELFRPHPTIYALAHPHPTPLLIIMRSQNHPAPASSFLSIHIPSRPALHKTLVFYSVASFFFPFLGLVLSYPRRIKFHHFMIIVHIKKTRHCHRWLLEMKWLQI